MSKRYQLEITDVNGIFEIAIVDWPSSTKIGLRDCVTSYELTHSENVKLLSLTLDLSDFSLAVKTE